MSGKVFGCDDPTYNPSSVRELSLLTQFSGITTLQSLVSEKQCKGLDQAWSCLWGVTTSHITPVHPTLNCHKAECLFIYLCIYFYFLSLACLFCLFLFCGCWFFFYYFLLAYFFLGFVFVCVRVCVCVLLSLSFFSLFVYFMCSFHMIAGRVRLILPLVGN